MPVASASGPQRSKRRGGVRRHNPLRSTKKKTNVDEGEQEDEQEDVQEDGWDVALSQFRAKLRDLVFDGEPLGEVLPEKVLAARITKLVKEELKRSVSRIFYCVLAPHFTNFVILATAFPGH